MRFNLVPRHDMSGSSCVPSAPGWRSALPHGLAVLALAACSGLAGCDRNGPAQPTVPKVEAGTATPATNSATAGVVPQSDSNLPASDRPGAPATGAVEAGQAGGKGSGSGSAPVPTGGDGAASAPASAASGR